MASRLQDVLQVGIRADQPLATDVATGTLYSVSDESFLIEQSDGAAWVPWGPTPTGGTLTNIRVSAGTTSNLLSALTFSNGSNVSFGLAASVITASVNTSLTNIKISAGASSTNLSALTFSNSNGVSFGLNGSVITGSIDAAAVTFSAGASSGSLASIVFSNSNGVSFGLNGSTITASVNTAAGGITNINVSAGATSYNLSNITFSNSNGVSFGITNSVVTASHNGLTTQTSPVASFFAVSNTTQATSGTQNISAVTFQGAGGVSVGVSNGSVVISGNTGGGGAGVTLSNWNNWGNISTNNVANNTIASIMPINLFNNVAFSNIAIPMSITNATANNLSSAYLDLSVSGVFYSRNGSTLSSITSFSNTMFQTWNSNNFNTVRGIAFITATLPAVTLSAGSYWLMLHMSKDSTATGATANTTGLNCTLQPIVVRNNSDTDFYLNVHPWGNSGATTLGLFPGQGVFSTNATLATVAFSDYDQKNTRGGQAFMVELRNETYQ